MTLVERSTQLDDPARALDQAAQGRGRTVLLSGEAGTGKTSLLRAFADATASHARVFEGRCDELITPRVLGPFRDMARHHRAVFAGTAVDDRDAVIDVLITEMSFRQRPAVATLRRMWRWTAPGGHLIIQQYDVSSVDVDTPLPVVDELKRIFLGTYAAAGRPVRLGMRLPSLLAEAKIGPPDGTEVVGRLEPLATAGWMLAATYRSIAPTAMALGLLTAQERDAWLTEITTAMCLHGDASLLWPLLIGVHVRRPSR